MDQSTADYLLAVEKKFINNKELSFPYANEKHTYNIKSVDGNEEFLLDVNRSGQIKLSRCTIQNRYGVVFVLARLDLDTNKPHRNPDGTILLGPHIHIFREGFDDKWAYLLNEIASDIFTDSKDLVTKFIEFCKYCNINDIPPIQGSI